MRVNGLCNHGYQFLCNKYQFLCNKELDSKLIIFHYLSNKDVAKQQTQIPITLTKNLTFAFSQLLYLYHIAKRFPTKSDFCRWLHDTITQS